MHIIQLVPLHPKTPSSLASFKVRLVLPFWYRLTQVVLEKAVKRVKCSTTSSVVSRFVFCRRSKSTAHEYSLLRAIAQNTPGRPSKRSPGALRAVLVQLIAAEYLQCGGVRHGRRRRLEQLSAADDEQADDEDAERAARLVQPLEVLTQSLLVGRRL